MTFVEAIKSCISNYARFSGRASRPEYWWFALFIFIVSSVLRIIDTALFGTDPVTQTPNGLLGPLFSLAMLLPFIAVGWRRMHDTGKPGWLLLLPMLVTSATVFFLMVGVMGFASMQNSGAYPVDMVGPAAFLGLAGMIAAAVVQVVLFVLLLWWLTRPSEAGANSYGPPPPTN